MIRLVLLLLWRLLLVLEFIAFTLVMYLLSYLPAALRPWYFRLFRY